MKTRRIGRKAAEVLIISLLQLGISHGSALGIRLLSQDAEAGARGDAFAATADNPSAVYYNPAGITQLPGHQFSLGFSSTWWDREQREPFTGQEVDAKDSLQLSPNLYYTFSPGDRLPSFGFGFYSPFGFSSDWPPFDPGSSLRMNGYLDYWVLNPGIAIPLGPKLSLAGGLQFAYSELQENVDYIDPRGLIMQIHNAGSGTGIGYNLGLLWRPHEQHAFGVSYHSAVSIDYDVRSVYHYDNGNFSQDGSFTAEIPYRFPMNAVIGYSFRPSDRWNFEFNLDWTDWDGAKPDNWESGFIYKWGVTRSFTNGWRTSAGYTFAESSVPDDKFHRLIPDSDQHLFSVGLSRSFKHCEFAVAYRFGYSEPRTIAGGINGNYLTYGIHGAVHEGSVRGKYEAVSQMLAVSAGCRF